MLPSDLVDELGHFDAPIKVQCADFAGADFAETGVWQSPRKALVLDLDAHEILSRNKLIAMENERLAEENARLQEELAATRQPPNCWWHPVDPWVAAEATQLGIYPGATVLFHSLKNAPELNGEQGTVDRFHPESGRWVVALLKDGEEKFAKPENLWCVSRVQDSCWRAGESSMVNLDYLSSASTTGGSTKSSFSMADDMDAQWRTTMMMRNLPNNYTRDMLVDLLDKEGFGTAYDLIYLPVDFRTEVGYGYAFINFVASEESDRFYWHFHGFRDWAIPSEKICQVSWSGILQGVQEHVERYRNSPLMHDSVDDQFKPALFSNGKRIPFPAPTGRVRAPRFRRLKRF